MNEWMVIAISVVVSGLVVAGGAWVYTTLRNKVQGYPYEDDVERVLLPLIYQAICAAYKMSEQSALAGNKLLDGVSKAAVANFIYDLLPMKIGGIPVGIIKTLVSREQFAVFVERVYQNFDANYDIWVANMDAAFEEWKRANQP